MTYNLMRPSRVAAEYGLATIIEHTCEYVIELIKFALYKSNGDYMHI